MQTDDTKTVIGTGSTVRGIIEGDEDLVVEGRVEGTVSLTKMLVVDPGGTVQAEVSCSAAVIHGVILGNIEASDSVRIAAGGRMAGDIRAPQVVLEEGAAFTGNIDMGEFSLEAEDIPEPAPEPPRPVRSPSLPARRPVPTRIPPVHAAPVNQPEPEVHSTPPVRSQAPRAGGGFSRPPMPVPSRSAPAPVPSTPPARQGAPEPRVRPVGRVKIKKPTI